LGLFAAEVEGSVEMVGLCLQEEEGGGGGGRPIELKYAGHGY